MTKIIFSSFYRLKQIINGIINHVRLNINGIVYADNLEINGRPLIVGNVIIGYNCRINSGIEYNPIGGDYRTILIAHEGKIIIGKNVGLSNAAIISQKEIIIEDNVRIGGSVKIYDTDFHSLKVEKRLSKFDDDIGKKAVVIKKGAFIGAHSIILKGVTIGVESIVGAGSVVRTSIPDREVWAGNPARFIRKVSEEDYENIMADESSTS